MARIPDFGTGTWWRQAWQETRLTQAQIGSSSPDARLRGKTVNVTFAVNDLKTLRLPEVDDQYLRNIGFEQPSRSCVTAFAASLRQPARIPEA